MNVVKETSINITADKRFIEPSLGFLASYVYAMPLGQKKKASLNQAFADMLELVVERNEGAFQRNSICIALKQYKEALEVQIQNYGEPIFPEQIKDERVVNGAKRNLDWLKFENLGRKGQVLKLGLNLESKIEDLFSRKQLDFAPDEIEIRKIDIPEISGLSALFHKVYGYDYINEYVYFPETLREMMDRGDLISIVALSPSGKLIGHVGLVRWNKNPAVYEAALGVIDPETKRNGLFGLLFHRAMEELEALTMQYCVYDLVTNHDFSQRLVSKYGCREMALFLGNQVSSTQARLESLGMGKDPKETDRYALLVGVKAGQPHPFGKEVVLPPNIGEPCEFILKPLGVEWVPTPRFYPMPVQGEYSVSIQPEQKAAVFDFHKPGRTALKGVLNHWRQLLREGIQYVAVDIPLNVPGIGQIYDHLARHGFFMAGFIPYHYRDVLGIRFQFLLPTRVNFDEIKVFSPTAQKILKMVKDDYVRNEKL